MLVFFSVGLVYSYFNPRFFPVVAAALLVLPFRAVLSLAVDFGEGDYDSFSPVISGIRNPRFLLVFLGFLAFPLIAVLLNFAPSWSVFGEIPYLLGAISVIVLIWSEAFYQKNFYFDRWHIIERFGLVAIGLIALIVSPLFLFLFMLIHRIITEQFDYPGLGGFNYTHSQLPFTLIYILGAFSVVSIFVNINPRMVSFLLLCGLASHYFHPGIAKIKNGVSYYIFENNPVSLFLNAYQIGWMSWLDENIVHKIGRISQKTRPLSNVFVVLTETGVLLILLWRPLSIVLLSSILVLHTMIFLSTGDNFWKWMSIVLAAIFGLIFIPGQSVDLFTDNSWFLMSIPFIVFAKAWMNPVSMNWLDSFYVEFFEFKADLTDGREIKLNPNIFRPYDSIISQGITGTLDFLGENPRLTFSYGGITESQNKRFHQILFHLIEKENMDEDESKKLVNDCGIQSYDEIKVKRLENLLEQFLDNRSSKSSMIQYFSSPREFYSAGIFEREDRELLGLIENIRVVRIDGIWTEEEFQVLNETEVLEVSVNEG